MQFTILIIDDEKNIREGLGAALELDGYNVKLAENGAQGLAFVEKGDIDLVITDLRMPGISGEQVIAKVKGESPGIPVIVLTGHGSIDSAVDAMRNGAYDFLTKPLNIDRLSLIVKRALAGRELEIRHSSLQEELDAKTSFESIIGKSAEMQRIFAVVRKAANSKASVLITGESGVGKELIANALHNLSARKDNPYIKVHCAALSETLLESELFGHEKGAFTGAVARKRGRFELAHTGTIFLDEIGEIDQNVQIKILRVLQDKRFERVGGEETVEVDVRVIAATNRDLEKEIAEHRFREDLYYRLNVVHIHVPPLRDRKDDIPLLLSSFLAEFAAENGKRITGIDSRARAALYKYDWPGNIRQLRNCIESAVVMCTGAEITLEDLPPTISGADDSDTIAIPSGVTLAEAEKILIRQNLAANNGNKSKTADVLGIGRKTLHRKLEEYGLDSAAELEFSAEAAGSADAAESTAPGGGA
ncbi:sigma-54-dependent transcriptional regulator [Treponema brennaborense]|uniref:Two component, sigma54 specific, transcriptional regulator, Fis family n=1 Tax=Treponema brennaborense (strain DSM 12168 / CIP 105900 / DD5/3) TaxID=906968 RepID=F4LKY6_TREBD|nr:sigma-54 dependent transcriptional regulator [Treponema brennaborense]AEE16583.1 two component, sigma54 specific, transcriptional regulator, Fis family [Treponema brennaborense DSM 12168]